MNFKTQQEIDEICDIVFREKDSRGITNIAKDIGVSRGTIYYCLRKKKSGVQPLRVLQKMCIFCNTSYESKNPQQKYCCEKCKDKDWRKKHPNKFGEYNRKCQMNKFLPCHFCGGKISVERRRVGGFYCSDECSLQAKEQAKVFRHQCGKELKSLYGKTFSEYKRKLGCCMCGYNKFSGSLDFHHKNPDDKEMKIGASSWYCQTEIVKKELEKCVLVCKNCHYELHDLYRKDKDEYWLKINKLPMGDNARYM